MNASRTAVPRRLRHVTSALVLAALLAALPATHAAARTGAASPLRSARCAPAENPGGDLLVVADLPLHGPDRSRAIQISQAISFVFARAGWQAGSHTISYQRCDDTTTSAGAWDAATCSANAAAYASDAAVVGVIGPLNSGCARLELPVANRAPNGPLALVSPSTTYPGLTHVAPGVATDEPARYSPSGSRSFLSILAADDVQGVADATLAARLHLRRLFVLDDQHAYGEGVAASVAAAAKKLGIAVVGTAGWDPSAASYAGLAQRVKAAGADGVFLGGLSGENGARLIADLRGASPSLAVLAPAGFARLPAEVTATKVPIYVSAAGLPLDRLPPPGLAFVRAFSKSLGGATIDPAAVYAAQAAQVLLQAIATSTGTRSSVAARLLGVTLPKTVLGRVSFDADGESSRAPVTIYRVAGGTWTVAQVIIPKSSLLSP